MTTNANTTSMTEIHAAITQRLIALGQPEDAAKRVAAIMIWNWDKESDLLFYAYCDRIGQEDRGGYRGRYDAFEEEVSGLDKEVRRLLYASLDAHILRKEAYPPEPF